jgi:hypothetical protein
VRKNERAGRRDGGGRAKVEEEEGKVRGTLHGLFSLFRHVIQDCEQLESSMRRKVNKASEEGHLKKVFGRREQAKWC